MAAKEPATAPHAEQWYPIVLGSSLTEQPSKRYYSLRYEFKPASIDTSRPGTLHKNVENKVTVEFCNNLPGKANVAFQGINEDCKDSDAVLFFDGKTLRLERLHRAVKTLRHLRLPGETAASVPHQHSDQHVEEIIVPAAPQQQHQQLHESAGKRPAAKAARANKAVASPPRKRESPYVLEEDGEASSKRAHMANLVEHIDVEHIDVDEGTGVATAAESDYELEDVEVSEEEEGQAHKQQSQQLLTESLQQQQQQQQQQHQQEQQEQQEQQQQQQHQQGDEQQNSSDSGSSSSGSGSDTSSSSGASEDESGDT